MSNERRDRHLRQLASHLVAEGLVDTLDSNSVFYDLRDKAEYGSLKPVCKYCHELHPTSYCPVYERFND